MKKKSLLLLTIMMMSYAYSQDIIVTSDSQKIDAKILEVSKSEIKYKEFDNIEGPTFVLSANEIVSIIYANGKVVLYNQDSPNQSSSSGEPLYETDEDKRAKANTALSQLFGDNTRQTNESQNNSVGLNTIGGNSWSLKGRKIISLPKPSTNFNQEGKVIVEILVNTEGKVISAKHLGGTVTDSQTIQLAIEAAQRAKFSKGDKEQVGTITYTFKLN